VGGEKPEPHPRMKTCPWDPGTAVRQGPAKICSPGSRAVLQLVYPGRG
jgi:hypothetical protein